MIARRAAMIQRVLPRTTIDILIDHPFAVLREDPDDISLVDHVGDFATLVIDKPDNILCF